MYYSTYSYSHNQIIVKHLLESDQVYLPRLAWKYKRGQSKNAVVELAVIRQATLEALHVAVQAGLPEQGPRGGAIWPVRYFVRQSA